MHLKEEHVKRNVILPKEKKSIFFVLSENYVVCVKSMHLVSLVLLYLKHTFINYKYTNNSV